MARSILMVVPLATAVAFTPTKAQNDPPAVPRADYALTNVRIVTAPGRVIERGTVLIQNGRIAAVGPTVTVPAGVVSMNLSGHSVFAGLIDAATSVGLPSPTRAIPAAAGAAPEGGRGGRGGGGGAPGGRGAAPAGRAGAPPPPVIPPEIDAAAEAAYMFSPTSDELAAFRAGGVTTVGLVFNGGLFPGRVGAALTGGYDESQLVLRTSAAQQVSFGSLRGAYPNTLIGALAYVHQMFLDAQHELALDRAFTAGRPGGRPSNDPFRRALMPAAGNEMPAWFVASTEREIGRVAEIAGDVGLRNWTIVGAREGWRTIPIIKQGGASAVVSLDWPNASSVTGRAFGTTGATPQPASLDAALNAAIRANAAELAKAGIPVAFASFGGDGGATFRDRIRATIEAGMPADDALRAATVTAATMLGIDAVVGSIEAGKIANLVVVTGNDLFASGTPIRHVFVDGRLYTMSTAQQGGGAGPGTSPVPSPRSSRDQ